MNRLPLSSLVPRPYRFPSRISGANGSDSHWLGIPDRLDVVVTVDDDARGVGAGGRDIAHQQRVPTVAHGPRLRDAALPTTWKSAARFIRRRRCARWA